jgi:NAD(P)-dependent dehydrogenase (short-subunit alcohol dehydrogenase family)
VNNAGGPGTIPYYPNVPRGSWRKVIDMYLISYMTVMQEALEVMPNGGAMVNISSMGGVGYGAYWFPEYAAAKAAVIRLSAALGTLARTRNVRVNCICPNWVATEKVRTYVPQMTEEQRAAWFVPAMENMARPEDIAGAVMHFLRDDSLAGRVMLCDERDSRWLLPVDTDFFTLAERLT